MARGDFTVAMVLEALDQASRPIQEVQNKLKGLDRAAAAVGGGRMFTRLVADLKGVGGAVRNVGTELAALSGRMTLLGLGITGLTYGFKVQFVDTAAEFERLRMSLEVVMGSAEKGRQTFDWLLQFAAKTPVTTATATKAFLLLKNAGIDPLKGSLQALVDYNARVGGSQENLTEITRQLGQAWMKGKLQMEEINVLTERMIPVIPLLAKALGKTEQAIMDMTSKGKIGRKELMALLQMMKREGAGAAAKFSRSWEGLTSTLSDNWAMLKNRIMEAGPFDWLKDKLAQLNAWLERLQADPKRLEEIGQALRRGFEAAEAAAVRWWGKMQVVAAWMGGWENAITAVLLSVAAVITGPLILAITQLGLALSRLLVAHPWLAGLLALGAAVGDLTANWERYRQAVGGAQNDMDRFRAQKGTETGGGWWATLTAGLDELFQKMTGSQQTISDWWGSWDRFDVLSSVNEALQDCGKWLDGLIAPLQETPQWLENLNQKLGPVNNAIERLAQGIRSVIEWWRQWNSLPAMTGPSISGKPLEWGAQKQSFSPLSAPAQKVDTGGLLRVKIDSAAPVRLVEAKTNDRRQRLRVDTGPIMVPV